MATNHCGAAVDALFLLLLLLGAAAGCSAPLLSAAPLAYASAASASMMDARASVLAPRLWGSHAGMGPGGGSGRGSIAQPLFLRRPIHFAQTAASRRPLPALCSLERPRTYEHPDGTLGACSGGSGSPGQRRQAPPKPPDQPTPSLPAAALCTSPPAVVTAT